MREKKIADNWRYTNSTSKYKLQLRELCINGAIGINDNFSLKINSGISALCGKNGSGKSTVLKSIFNHLKSNVNDNERFLKAKITSSIIVNGIETPTTPIDNVYFTEPSIICNNILSYLKDLSNVDELLEGIDSNQLLKNGNNLNILNNIIGKVYKNVDIYEIEEVIPGVEVFPFIRVELLDGTKYDCLTMGAGEYICMYLFWLFNWIEKDSILLIDELENCMSAYSQEYFMDYLAFISHTKGIWAVISTHSKTILDKIGVSNTSLVSNLLNKGSKIVSPRHESKYFEALGIKGEKIGAFLVEDKFAFMFLKSLFNFALPEVLHDYHIVSLHNGESDIQKVVKHFKPNNNLNFELYAVFDSDMWKTINNFSDCYIPVIALPSLEHHNPEVELWDVLSNNLDLIASKLSVPVERFNEKYEICQSKDHHDRFMQFSRLLNISEEHFVTVLSNVWCENNNDLVQRFIIAILAKNKKMSRKNLRELVGNSYSLDAKNLIDENGNDIRCLFNGSELLIS